MALTVLLASLILDYFTELNGTPWIFVFGGLSYLDDFRRRIDRLCQASRLSQRTFFHLWRQVGPGIIGRMLSLGMADILVRRCAFILFVVVKTLTLFADDFVLRNPRRPPAIHRPIFANHFKGSFQLYLLTRARDLAEQCLNVLANCDEYRWAGWSHEYSGCPSHECDRLLPCRGDAKLRSVRNEPGFCNSFLLPSVSYIVR